jgi:hypothetical protein
VCLIDGTIGQFQMSGYVFFTDDSTQSSTSQTKGIGGPNRLSQTMS